jgi:hypothetical protein
MILMPYQVCRSARYQPGPKKTWTEFGWLLATYREPGDLGKIYVALLVELVALNLYSRWARVSIFL